MRKIKVMHLIHQLKQAGGAENGIINLANHINIERFDTSISPFDGKGVQTLALWQGFSEEKVDESDHRGSVNCQENEDTWPGQPQHHYTAHHWSDSRRQGHQHRDEGQCPGCLRGSEHVSGYGAGQCRADTGTYALDKPE